MLILAGKPLGWADWKPGAWRWLLAAGWWLLLGPPLRRGLRSALGGLGPPGAALPPTRPRRPKAARPRPQPLPYPAAA